MADVYDFKVNCGADHSFTVQYLTKADDPDAPNVPVDLTGFKARMQIRKQKFSESFDVELTTENSGLVWVEQSAGKLKVVLTNEQTDNLTGGVYDLEIESASGIVTRILEGKVTASRQVTR